MNLSKKTFESILEVGNTFNPLFLIFTRCVLLLHGQSKPFTTQSRLLSTLRKVAFRKHSGKRRKCWLPAFSPFPTMFSTVPRAYFSFCVTFILSSVNALNLDWSKILLFGKELTGRNNLTHSHTMTPLDAPGKQAF